MEEEVKNGTTNSGNGEQLKATGAGVSRLLKEPKSWLMWAILLPVMVFFFGGWFVVTGLFEAYENKLTKESVATYGYEGDKLKQMAYETNILYFYGYEDVVQNRYRMPVDVAIEKTLNYYQQKKSFTEDN